MDEVQDLKGTMESKRKIWESLGTIKKSLGTLSSIFWGEKLRPLDLGANK